MPNIIAGKPLQTLPPFEGISSRVFAFVDIDNPVVAWEAYRGVLVSANAEHTPPNCPVSMMFTRIVQNQNNARLRNELLIENFRQQYFPHCNSRLTGMYFFDDRHSAERVAEDRRNWGGHFCSENLVEMQLFSTAQFSRHDANWITFAPLDHDEKISNHDWLSKYWSGEPLPEKEPAWEIIAQGRSVILGADIRIRAYMTLQSHFPECVSILEIGRIAAHLGSDLGHLSPWLICNADGTINLTFHLDMRDANNPEFLEKLHRYTEPVNHKDLTVGGDHFCIPHFSECKCQFNVTNEFLISVHRNS